jgi:hypothetical protein
MPFSFLMRHSSTQAEESRERNELGGGEEEIRRLRVPPVHPDYLRLR